MSEQAASVALSEEFDEVKQRNLWLDALERLVRNKAAMLGLFISLVVILLAIFGPFLAPYDYLRTDVTNLADTPSWSHWMGTDLIGRDVFSRVLNGARTAVFVAFVVITISNAVGIALGALAAYGGGRIDDSIMRLTDIVFSVPELLLAAFASTAIRAPVVEWMSALYTRTQWEFLRQTTYVDYLLVFGALALVSWPGTARLIRGQILSLREQDFIRAERALGVPGWTIIRKHLIPNAIAPVVVSISISVGGVMLLESSLSFLGLGIQPPGASWGNMISENLLEWRNRPHLVAMPGLMLAVAVFGFNFLGDGINDAINPRQIKR